jgi:signal transduction histidine kinase
MELELLREELPPAQAARLDQTLDLVDDGIRSIRNVTDSLRPSLLDDLGLLPALRSLVADFSERSGIPVGLAAPPALPGLSQQAELAVFRALQEALSNVARHAGARSVDVHIAVQDHALWLQVQDDGCGPSPADARPSAERGGHMGLAGMRERISALGGTVRLQSAPGGGAVLEVRVPVPNGGDA